MDVQFIIGYKRFIRDLSKFSKLKLGIDVNELCGKITGVTP